jgi:hypothetical protein
MSISRRSKVIQIFRFALKMPSENFREGIAPYRIFCEETTKGVSLGQSESIEVQGMKIGRAVGPVCVT